MSLKTAIASRVLEQMLSPQRRLRSQARWEHRRRRRGDAAIIDYFHQSDDPYSHLMLQLLPALQQRYAVVIRPWLVGPPPAWAAPEPHMLIDWSRRDAAALARRLGLAFSDPGRQPEPGAVASADAALADAIAAGHFLDTADGVSRALWDGALPPTGATGTAQAALEAGNARRAASGHYLGATLFYGGEWYWGPDRLHYLEHRLRAAGLCQHSTPGNLLVPPAIPGQDTFDASGRELHFFLSFRSPYTYLAAPRVFDLAHRSGATLHLRFVLPMVMRGLPVPQAKRLYILRDVAREAASLNLPFGRLADPLGRPVERGYSLLPWARAEGRGEAFCLAFLRAVWSQGIDAGTDSGLRRIVEAAELSWADARKQLGDEGWRAEAESNRAELIALGLWGVPSFRVGDTSTWGQDRLWLIEKALRAGPVQ